MFHINIVFNGYVFSFSYLHNFMIEIAKFSKIWKILTFTKKSLYINCKQKKNTNKLKTKNHKNV